MMKWMQKFVAVKLAVITAISTCLPSNDLSANYYQGPYDNNCCQPCEAPCEAPCQSGWGNGWVLLGAAALGAAAGAATGAAVGGGRGKRGRHGTDAENPFVSDVGQALSFNFVLALSLDVLGAVITPFVSTPDGRVISGTSQVATILGLAIPQSIVIDNPVFGTYTAGYQTTGGVVTLTAAPIVTVSASRDGSLTSIGLVTVGLGLLLETGSQTFGDFTYGAEPIP